MKQGGGLGNEVYLINEVVLVGWRFYKKKTSLCVHVHVYVYGRFCVCIHTHPFILLIYHLY